MKELVRVRVQYASKGSSAVRPTNGLYLYLMEGGSWLRHCATSRKVAGSIPEGVIGIFY
jgi:hypothetical protein